jgi:iron complex outermembrane receptor protein
MLSYLITSFLLLTNATSTETLRPVVIESSFLRGHELTTVDAETLVRLSTGAISLVNPGDVLRGRAVSVADSLAGVPGVIASPRFGPLDTRLSIRGSGLVRTGHGKGVQLRWGFLPIQQADGNFDAHLIDPFSTETILVYKGANAFGTGSVTSGGSIDFVPLTGKTATSARLRAEAGSFGYINLQSSGSFDEGSWDGYGMLGYAESAGFRDQSAFSIRRANGNIGFEINETSRLRALVNFMDMRSQWPGTLTLEQALNDPRQANPTSRARNQGLDNSQLLAGLQGDFRLGGIVLETAFGTNVKSEYHPTPQSILELDSVDYIFDLRATGYGDSPLPSVWTVGFRPSWGFGDQKNFAYAGPPTSPAAAQSGTLTNDRRREAANLVGFFSLKTALSESLAVDAGLQINHSLRADHPVANPMVTNPAPGFRFDYTALTPKIGLLAKVNDSLLFFTNIGRTFEPPSTFDLSGNAPLQTDRIPMLKAEKAWTWEIGSRGERAGLSYHAVFFQSRIQNEYLRLDPAAGPMGPITNAEGTERTGLEGSLAYRFEWDNTGHALTAQSTFQWLRSRFRDDPNFGNNALAGLPEYRLIGSLTWENLAGWYAGPSVEWVPQKQFIDHLNTQSAPGYTVWNLRAGRQTPRGWGGYVEVRNLFDKAYIPSVNVLASAPPNASAFFPADGRGFYAGLDFSW